MKPCSVWCRPEEGIHVRLSAHRNRIGPPATLADVRREIGLPGIVSFGDNCVLPNTPVLVIAVDLAEAPVDPGWDVMVVETVRIAT